MKRFFTLFFLAAFSCASIHAQAVGDYGSIAVGNWNGTTTWGIWNGSSFVATASTPDGSSQDVYLRSGFNVTIPSGLSITLTKKLTLTSAGIIIASGGTLILGNGSNITRIGGGVTNNGTLTFGTATTDLIGININANLGLSGELSFGPTGKVTLTIATGVTYTYNSTNRIITDLVLNGTITDDGTAGRILTVKGNITGTGTQTAAGSGTNTIKLAFPSSSQTISGVTLKNLNLATTSGTNVTLTANLTITSLLTLSGTGSGAKLILSTFDLSTPAISGGSSSCFVAVGSTGKLIMPVAASTATLFPIGSATTSYDPVTITPTNAATFSVKVSQTFTPSVNNAPNAVPRQWDLTATGTGATTLAFTPLSTTLTGTNTPGTAVYGHVESGFWVERPASYTGGTWTVTGATSFSPFGVGVLTAFNSVLGVDLKNFSVKKQNDNSLLTWSTASEKDNALFNIEHSTNGADFKTVGEVKGNGTTNAVSNYTFEHTTPSVSVNYYRLKQVDFNGNAAYSAVRSVLFGKNGGLVIKTTLVSNTLDIVVSDDTTTPFSIFNISGQQVLATKAQGTQRLDVSALPSGLYIVRTASGDTGRFVKQ